MIKKIKENASLLIGYIIFAGIATIVDFSLLYSLTEFFYVHYFTSAAFAYMGGMITNYTLNKIFNFKNKSKKIFKQFALFMTVALTGLILNQLIIYVLVEYFQFWYMIAKLVSVGIVMIWSFIGHKLLTFKVIQ